MASLHMLNGRPALVTVRLMAGDRLPARSRRVTEVTAQEQALRPSRAAD